LSITEETKPDELKEVINKRLTMRAYLEDWTIEELIFVYSLSIINR